LENEGQNWINKYIEEVPTHLATLLEETVAVKEAKENEAKSIQSLSQQVDLLKKENEDLRKTLKELSDNPPSKKM
jgi:archaellum component FlaC